MGDYLGHSVSLSSDGTIVAIGTPYNGGNGSNQFFVEFNPVGGTTKRRVS